MEISPPLRCAIDHLVVAAASLEAGARYVQDMLGVEPEAGGEHARMGTHNRLLKLGAALYLEVIAIDPAAPHPAHARWFALDRRAPHAPPRLVTWVVRTNDIEAAAARCGVELGNIETMTRGSLSWRITIPRDGSLPFDGVMPALIQWDVDEHPAMRMADRGCTLAALEGHHAEAVCIRAALEALGLSGVKVAEPAPGEPTSLAAAIDTDKGRCILSSRRDA
jgi:glyoxalase-like protein